MRDQPAKWSCLTKPERKEARITSDFSITLLQALFTPHSVHNTVHAVAYSGNHLTGLQQCWEDPPFHRAWTHPWFLAALKVITHIYILLHATTGRQVF